MTYHLVFDCSVKSLVHQKPLGSALALGEGWSVGNSVGDKVGDSVGDEVGDPVGDEVNELLSKDLMRKRDQSSSVFRVLRKDKCTRNEPKK